MCRGTPVEKHWSRLTFMKIHKNIFMSIYRIELVFLNAVCELTEKMKLTFIVNIRKKL